MISSILDRLPTHVVRIAMVYCALDNCCLISTAHLKAAFAFCDYYRRSAEWLFGEKTGSRDADEIYKALCRGKPAGMTKTEIRDYVFDKHIRQTALDEALGLLLKADLVACLSKPNPRNGPRFIQKWYAK